MASPDSIFQSWKGMVDDDFRKTIEETFSLKHDDGYVYRVESFAMTLAQVEAAIATGQYIYRYAVDGVMTKVDIY
jgi:ribosomal protein S3AE